MSVKSLVCLSSGKTPQYRLDVLRLLALPGGLHIQFRYGEDLIPAELRSALSTNALVNSHVLLAHVDGRPAARRNDGNCLITPCRHARLVFSRQLGAFFFLQFSLHEFAPCDDIESFQTCIKGNRPHWASNDLVGHWCFESALAVQGCAKQATLDGFQAVIRSLWRREDFADEPFFFAVDGPYVRGTSDAIKSSRGEFLLNSDKEYAVNIFHFHPDGDEHPMPTSAGILKVDMAAEQLKSVTRPTAQIESPYDLKTFYFRTSRVMRNESASIVFSIECNSGGPLESQPEIFLPMKIKPSWFKNVVSVVLIAGLLFFQQFLSATAKGPISFSTTAVLLLLAIATALIVVFGLQKQV